MVTNPVNGRRIPISVRLEHIKGDEVLNPIHLTAQLDWSLKQGCTTKDESCAVLDPRSVSQQILKLPKIFFQTGIIKLYVGSNLR